MKNWFGYIFTLVLFTFSACKKDDTAPLVPKAPLTIKYEVNFTSALKDTTANALIKYTDGNGILQTAADLLPGSTSWSKTITVNSNTRPFPIAFQSVGTGNNYFYLNAAGTVSAKIYVDNGIRAYESSTTVNGPGYYFDSFSLIYTIQ